MRGTRGFNLLELIVVLAIMAMLVSIALPNLLEAMNRSRQSATIADMRTLASALERYAVEKSHYPIVKTVAALRPEIEPRFIKQVPTRDGWEQPLEIAVDSKGVSYTLRSPGKDGTYREKPPEAGESPFIVDLVLVDGAWVQGPPDILQPDPNDPSQPATTGP